MSSNSTKREGFVDKEGNKVKLKPASHTHEISDVDGLQDVLDDLGEHEAETVDGVKALIAENALEEKVKSVADNTVAGYLTDKNGNIIAKLLKDGSVEWIVRNSKDRAKDELLSNIADFIADLSREVTGGSDSIVKYLVDKNNIVIATINNVGDVDFIGGGGFDGEKTKSKNVAVDAVKVLTDNNGAVIGWISGSGVVHLEEAEINKLTLGNNSNIGVSTQVLSILGFVASGTANHKFNSDKTRKILLSTKGDYKKNGVRTQYEPVISIQDDDAFDYQLPQSHLSSALASESPTPSYEKRGGFASLLFPVLKSLNEKYKSSMRGKLTCGVAAEGQRIGLTPLYGTTDTFDGNLNTCGKMVKALVEHEGWECVLHSMTARYYHNSYLVNGLDSEFANSLLSDATYSGTNGLGYTTTTCYDTVTKENYKVKEDRSGWDPCPLHYAKPYLALTKAADSPLVLNPTYSFEYQVKTWKDRADAAGLPYKNILAVWGTSHGSLHVCEDMKYVDTVLAVGGITDVNTVPFKVCPNRNPLSVSASANGITEHTDDYNVYNKIDYEKLIGIVDDCIENGGWAILRGHANEAMCFNGYSSYFTDLYGQDADDCGGLCYKDNAYPPEWIIPLTYDELMDMIGENENDYWNTPPSRLNISSWDEWYPCPGTTMAMIYDVLEYAISKGVRFDTAENVLKERGNILAVGCETASVLSPDKRLPESSQIHSYCKIGADGSVEYHNV